MLFRNWLKTIQREVVRPRRNLSRRSKRTPQQMRLRSGTATPQQMRLRSGTATPLVEILEDRTLLAAACETSVNVVGNDLVVTDINGGNSADDLSFSISGVNLVITDNNAQDIDLVGVLDGGIGDETPTVEIPLAAFTGVLDINTLAGADTINLAALTLTGNHILAQNSEE
jgi:hypothetical protein